MEVIADLIIEYHAGLILQRFLDGLGAKCFYVVGSNDDDLASNLTRRLFDIL